MLESPSRLISLGAGKDKATVLSSVSLMVLSFFYFFVVGSALQPMIYTFQHRVTYENIFVTHIYFSRIQIHSFFFRLLSLGFIYPLKSVHEICDNDIFFSFSSIWFS